MLDAVDPSQILPSTSKTQFRFKLAISLCNQMGNKRGMAPTSLFAFIHTKNYIQILGF